MDIKVKLGAKLKQLRKDKNLSQEKFALSIDMDRTYYASVESGKRNVSLDNLYKISQGFYVSLSILFKNIDDK